MIKKSFVLCLSFALPAYANDSMGFVATGGVTYLKSKDIQMFSEDLFISKKLIRVDYQFKNLSAHDITETILFPLPRVESYSYSEEADAEGLIKSFKVWANGQPITPQAHARAYLSKSTQNKDQTWNTEWFDVTDELKKCGFSNDELMNPWTKKFQDTALNRKFLACKRPKVVSLIKENYDADEKRLIWSSEIIYSWTQTFKANAMTSVKHEYQPLLGGSVAMSEHEQDEYCIDKYLMAGLKKTKSQATTYSSLGYVLKTGANWARPIQNFKMTIERDKGEFVSLCWAGKVNKISPTQFQIVERNFLPKQDANIIFIQPRY